MNADALEISKRAPEVQEMFGSIAARYDLVNTVLSFGIHHLWKRLIARNAPAGADVVALDICTGTGDLLPLLSARCGTVIGLDFCRPMLAAGVNRERHHLPVMQGDALRLPIADESIDVVTVAFGVRNLEQLEQGLGEMRRVLKPGGVLLVLEFGTPTVPVFREFYGLYSRHLMPRIGGLISGNRKAYTYLPKTSASFPCGGEFVNVMRRLGFSDVNSRSLSGGIAYLYRGVKA